MNHLPTKIKEVYLPFLVVSIGTILIYNLLRWIFDLKLGILPLKEDVLNYWMPIALPWIPILMLLRKRIRILNVRGKRDNGYFAYQFTMAAAIAIPLVISQHYLEKASFNLISINNIAEIKNHPDEKYFKVQTFGIDKNAHLSYATARTSGRNNDKLNFYLYLASPFKNTDNIWYGLEYKRSVSNRLSKERKNTHYRSFVAKSQRQFETYDFQNVTYFEKLGYSDAKDGFIEAISERTPNANAQIILVPETANFEQRPGNTFFWTFGAFGIGAFIIFLMVLIPKIDEKNLRDFQKDKPLEDDDLQDFLEFLDPRGPYKTTALLILINIAVFVAMVIYGLNIISPTARELLEIGGNRRFEVINGAYWRLFTSIFIHAGFLHLFINMFGLVISASFLEGILGRTKLIVSFIITGIFASLASVLWYQNTVSVGASGAIFGLYGVILAFTVFKIFPKYTRKITWMLLGLYAGVSLVFGFFGGIDNAAHIGGLVSGFVLGGIFILTDKERLLKNAN